MIKWFKENFMKPIPITPNMGRRTPYGSLTGGTTPGGGTTGRPGITPGALSLAGGNTPYGGTPGMINVYKERNCISYYLVIQVGTFI